MANLGPMNCCGATYLQCRRCCDNALSSVWIKSSDVPASNVFKWGSMCYKVVGGDPTSSSTTGKIIATSVQSKASCADASCGTSGYFLEFLGITPCQSCEGPYVAGYHQYFGVPTHAAANFPIVPQSAAGPASWTQIGCPTAVGGCGPDPTCTTGGGATSSLDIVNDFGSVYHVAFSSGMFTSATFSLPTCSSSPLILSNTNPACSDSTLPAGTGGIARLWPGQADVLP